MNYNSRSAFRSLGLIQQIFLVWQLVQVKLFHKRPKSRVFSEFSYLSNLFSDNITLVKTKTKSVLVAYTLNGIAQQIWLRKGSSDFKVFQSVILNHEYKSATKCVNDNPEFFIVDAGANIGTTLLYFKAFYPNATIIAIEPDKNNFRQLKLNIEQNKLENIKVLQKALWTSNEPLEIRNDFRDGKEWSLKVQPIGLGVSSVVGTTLTELLALVPSKQLDLLKIDIEGAERYLFADENFISNLEFVKNIIMELHEEYNVGEIVQQSIENSKLFSVTFRGDVNMYVSNR